MSLAEWDGKYMTGLPDIDKHHQHLFNLIQKAFHDHNRGASDQGVKKLLDELMEYAAYHFSSEEIMMGEIGYPKLLEHCSEHTIFTNKVEELLELYQTFGGSVLTSILIFLNTWLTQHILQKDMDYVHYHQKTPPTQGKVASA